MSDRVFLSNRVSAQQDPQPLAFSFPFKQCWSYQSSTIKNSIASDNDKRMLFVVSAQNLLSMNFNSGKKLWETNLGGEVVSKLISIEGKDNIYVAVKSFSNEERSSSEPLPEFSKNMNGPGTIKLRSIGKNTGITNWQTSININLSKKNEVSIFAGDNKIFVTDQNGTITTLNETNGKILNSKSLNLESNDGYIYAAGKNVLILVKNEIILAELETGKYLFNKETNSNLTTALLFDNTALILGGKKGELFSIDLNTGKVGWKSRFGAEISNISSTPEGILVTSFDNFIYLTEPKSGKVIWKKRLDARLIIEPFLFGEYLSVITVSSPKATVLDLNKGKLVNQIYIDADNYFVSSPVSNNYLIAFPTARGIFAFTSSNNRCPAE